MSIQQVDGAYTVWVGFMGELRGPVAAETCASHFLNLRVGTADILTVVKHC